MDPKERGDRESQRQGEDAKLSLERQELEARVVAAATPRTFSQVIGQVQAVERMRILKDIALSTGEPPPHILLLGPDGIGKRTLSSVFANELETTIQWTPAAEVGGTRKIGKTYARIVFRVDENDGRLIVFSEDVDRMVPGRYEGLLVAMKKRSLDVSVRFHGRDNLFFNSSRPFTLIGAASDERAIPRGLREQFSIAIVLRPYSEGELAEIAIVQARARNFDLTPEAALLIATLAKHLPQLAHLLRFVEAPGCVVTEEQAATTLNALGFVVGGLSVGAAEDLSTLSGVEFERVIQKLLETLGFTAELTRATGDGGIDIVARLDRPMIGGRYLIQCKRFREGLLVGVPTVREFYGAVVADRAAMKGIMITTSGFTTQAREFAAGLPLELINGEELRGLLDHGTESL